MLIFNTTKTGLLDRSLNLTSGTFYYHLVTTAPTNPAIAQVSGLAIATGGNYGPAVLGAPPPSSLLNQAGILTTQNSSWNLLTIAGSSPILGSVLCRQTGASPAATDVPLVYNPFPSPYSPNGSDFTLTPPAGGVLRLGYDYIVTAVTATTVTLSVAHPVTTNELADRSAIFSNLLGNVYPILSNTAVSNGSVVLTLQATNLVADGVTTNSRLRFSTNGIIFTQVLLGLLNRSFDLSSGTFYAHLVTTAPTDPTFTQVAQLTLATGGSYAPVLLSNPGFAVNGNVAIFRADDPVWANLTTNLTATIKGFVVAKRIGGSFATTDPIVCYKPIAPTQFPTGYTPNGATFTAQTTPATLGLLRFL